MSGGGSDPSAYSALSPGGRFPGDIANYLSYLRAQNTGGQLGNGDPSKSNVQIPGSYGKLLSLLYNGAVNNARTGGAGQAPGDPLTDGGYPFQAWSGPGASFGPPGGSLNGLIDQGNGNNVDGRDDPFAHLDSGTPVAPSGGGHHGGGGGGGSFTFQPYNGIGFQSSFVGYSPTQPGAVQHPAEIIHHLVNAGTPAQSPSSPGIPGGGKGGAGGGTSGGGGGGRASGKIPGVQYGGTPPKVPPGGSTRPDGRIFDASGRTIYIPGPGGGAGGSGAGGPGGGSDPGVPISPESGTPLGGQIPVGGIVNAITGGNPISSITPTDRDSHGLNFNNIDKGTPGWTHDPTQGIQNTAGMPLGTLPDPHGMTADQYMEELHRMGYSQEDIANLVGPYGFRISNPQQGPPTPGGSDPGNADNVGYGWGVGPVVRGPDGYKFGNQGVGNNGGGGKDTASQTLANAGSLWWGLR